VWLIHAQLTAGVRTVVVLATNVTVFGSLWIVQFVVLDRVVPSLRSPSPR